MGRAELGLLLVFVALTSLGVDGQQVNVTIFTESQCPFCTPSSSRTNLALPRHPSRHHEFAGWICELKGDYWSCLQIVPFGKGNCEYTFDRQLACTCMHGPTECDPEPPPKLRDFGLSNLDEAYQRCLSRLSPRTQQRLIECSKTQTGEVLNYYSMVNTHRAGIRIWPTMYVNGQFFDRSYPVETKICEHTSAC
ncbi:hypothetical protein M3Y99_00400200 [Aphelenchoides fujianensis]|nr:hypothetical protein M3Y99_00400200 [Aphelenchoides fujianensis]